jgi:hypothetical protein
MMEIVGFTLSVLWRVASMRKRLPTSGTEHHDGLRPTSTKLSEAFTNA